MGDDFPKKQPPPPAKKPARPMSPEQLAALQARAAKAAEKLGNAPVQSTVGMNYRDESAARARPGTRFITGMPVQAPMPAGAPGAGPPAMVADSSFERTVELPLQGQAPPGTSVPFGQPGVPATSWPGASPPQPTAAIPHQPVPASQPTQAVSPWAPEYAHAPGVAIPPRPPDPIGGNKERSPTEDNVGLAPAPVATPPTATAAPLETPPTEDPPEGYATPKNRMASRQLQQLMVTENAELAAWAERNVGADSRLTDADLRRMRAILLNLSGALHEADDAHRQRILDAWRALTHDHA